MQSAVAILLGGAAGALAANEPLALALKNITDAASIQCNCSVSLSVRTPTLFASQASGTVDSEGRVVAKPTDKYAWGSVTKTMTGAAILKHVAAGRLKLEGIKSAKLQSLHSAGVPQKYTVDLQNKRFT